MTQDLMAQVPPERIKLIMGADGPRIWWWKLDPTHLPDGEVIEYVRAASAPSPAATGSEIVAWQYRTRTRKEGDEGWMPMPSGIDRDKITGRPSLYETRALYAQAAPAVPDDAVRAAIVDAALELCWGIKAAKGDVAACVEFVAQLQERCAALRDGGKSDG